MADYFEILGVDRHYNVDKTQLEDAYFQACKDWHPDKVAPEKRMVAVQRTALLNDAYKTLRNDARRAEHLLAQLGVAISEHETLSPGFLMEILEKREALATAKQQGDEDAVEEAGDEMREKKKRLLSDIGEAFDKYFAGGDKRLLETIKSHLILLRYVERFLEACDEY